MSLKNILLKAASKISFTKYQTSLKAGDKAPAIKGIDQDGKMFDAKSLKGKKWFCIFIRKMILRVVLRRLVVCVTIIKNFVERWVCDNWCEC